jgi:hypothetical protein
MTWLLKIWGDDDGERIDQSESVNTLWLRNEIKFCVRRIFTQGWMSTLVRCRTNDQWQKFGTHAFFFFLSKGRDRASRTAVRTVKASNFGHFFRTACHHQDLQKNEEITSCRKTICKLCSVHVLYRNSPKKLRILQERIYPKIAWGVKLEPFTVLYGFYVIFEFILVLLSTAVTNLTGKRKFSSMNERSCVMGEA